MTLPGTSRHWLAFTLAATSLGLTSPSVACAQRNASPPRVRVVSGTSDDGSATHAWLLLVRRRVAPQAHDSIAAIRAPLTHEQRAWESLIRARANAWPSMLPGVAWPYAPVQPPATITVVVGNRGAEDAFTHDDSTIGFDLAALQRAYGDAARPENRERIDRFFRHETVHLMQKGWWKERPYAIDTPLAYALADMWSEGLGNRESLSSRWDPTGDAPSAATVRALARLSPRLVARLAALVCLDRGPGASALLRDLSFGPFEEKWGALPVALWLADEARADSLALRRFVRAGPDGVWSLAERHLSPALAATLGEVRRAATRCGTEASGAAR